MIIGKHPRATEAGSLVALEEYGPGEPLRWWGWRVALDTGGECYANAADLRRTSR